MDAKQACDKLNGFNFQNRYLVGAYRASCAVLPRVVLPRARLSDVLLRSPLPPAREDGQVERGPRGPQGEFSAAQEATRHRLTITEPCRQAPDLSTQACNTVQLLYHVLVDHGCFVPTSQGCGVDPEGPETTGGRPTGPVWQRD